MLDILSIPDEVRRLGHTYGHRVLKRSDGKPTAELAVRFGLKRSDKEVLKR